jgi:hypothetical protein
MDKKTRNANKSHTQGEGESPCSAKEKKAGDRLFKVGGGLLAARELRVPFLGRIPIDPLVVDKCDSGHALMADSVESAAKEAFMHLIQKLLDTLEPSRKEAAPRVH